MGPPTFRFIFAGDDISARIAYELQSLFGDRIQTNSILVVVGFAAVLSLESQSAASWASYALGIAMLLSILRWNDVFAIRYFWLICALVLFLLATSLWSDPFRWEGAARIGIRGLLVILFVIACAECQFRDKLPQWLGRSLAIVASVSAAVALATFFESREYTWGGRLKGLGQLDNPIIAGLIFIASAILVLDLVVFDRSVTWKRIGAVCLFVLVVAIYYCRSRTAWLGGAFGLGVYILAVSQTDTRRFAGGCALLAGLAITLVVGLMYAGELVREWILPRGDSYRLGIWSAAFARIADQGAWLFGMGINTPDGVTVNGQDFDHPHSLYVSILFQGGIVGFLLFVLLNVVTVRLLLENYNRREAKMALSLLSIALTGYLTDGHELVDKVSDVWFLYWLPVAICLGLAWHKPRIDPEF